ncbi:V-set and immunoglobulin domain-containing protein 10-like protein, partial [Ophiophagus hannah]
MEKETGSLLLLAGPSISEWTLTNGPQPGTASLTWTVPNGSAVTSFVIQMRGPKQHRSAEEWSTVEVLGATNRSTAVIGLQPQTAYAFQIVPYLGLQAGNATQIQTLQPDDVAMVNAVATNIEEEVVEWVTSLHDENMLELRNIDSSLDKFGAKSKDKWSQAKKGQESG